MNIRLQPPYKYVYSEMPMTIETPQGIVYHIEHCIKGMNKFDRGTKEYEIFRKTFAWICAKNNGQMKLEKENEVFKI